MANPPWSHNDSRYRPRYDDRGPPRPPPEANAAMYHFRGNARDRDSRRHDSRRNGDAGHQFSFRAPKRVSERPLLRQRDNSREERVLASGVQRERFRDLDNLTDSDEADMEDSESEEQARAKRVKTETAASNVDTTPKWSNPDPYTSLPAPNETTGKKIDFVKMIRKARNDLDKQTANAGDKAMDFISLSMQGDGAGTNPAPTPPGTNGHIPLPARPPLGPSALHPKVNLPPDELLKTIPVDDDTGQALGKRKRGDDKTARTAGRLIRVRRQDAYYSNAMILDVWMAADEATSTPWLRHSQAASPAIALHKEILDFYEWVKPQDYEFAIRRDCINRLSETMTRFQPGGNVQAFGSFGAGLFLPTGDMDLVFLEPSFQNRLRRGERGINAPLTRNQFERWVAFINRSRIAVGPVLGIRGAKVPIIKFRDKVSGLKIDLSFNNDTGLVANDTFLKWKASFPAMPIIVSIIKQFLMIRGLNDVSTGGLGGFSTICLVTSLVQHLPSNGGPQNLGDLLLQFLDLYGNHLNRDKVAIRMDPPGYIDKESNRLQMFNNDKKGRLTIVDPHRPDNNISGGTSEIALIFQSFADAHQLLQDRLALYDSNQQTRSFLTELIGGNFDAYNDQRNTLYSLHIGRPGSIAPAICPVITPTVTQPPSSRKATVVAEAPHVNGNRTKENEEAANGDDTSSSPLIPSRVNDIKTQPTARRRTARLKRVLPNIVASVGDVVDNKQAVRLSGYTDTHTMYEDVRRPAWRNEAPKLKPAERRAARLKALRPDIKPLVGSEINVQEAMKLGGYNTKEDMVRDLDLREGARKK